MKILMVAPLRRPIDPKITASRPRVILDLIEGLAKKGHEISVLGTGDSEIPNAKLIPLIDKAINFMPAFENPFYAETGFLVRCAKKLEELSGEFDIIHNHQFPEFINLLVEDKLKCPMVTTVHAQMTPEMDEALASFPDSNLVAISKSAESLANKSKISRMVYNGVDTNLYAFNKEKEDYLLWIGRLAKSKDDKGEFIDPKGVKWAIKLAEATGARLLMGGNVEDVEFFEQEVKPHLNDKIKWIAEISAEQPLSKQEVADLMQKAKAFLMTINWEEPFGLVMAEAMSCGTPVIAFDRGSVPELIEDGKTGFIVDPEKGVDGLVEAYNKIDQIDPQVCRTHVEEKFSTEKMVENYEKVYLELKG